MYNREFRGISLRGFQSEIYRAESWAGNLEGSSLIYCVVCVLKMEIYSHSNDAA